MSSIQSQLDNLCERVKLLERIHTKTNRGRTNQRGAAAYLNRSREYLRQLHLRGKGPRRGADGTYSFDDLDAFAEENSEIERGCGARPSPGAGASAASR
jgi:hypothetical protein